LERLPLVTERSRALEIVMGGKDFDADTAERYGWINRAVPDVDLDSFVERFATRDASFGTAGRILPWSKGGPRESRAVHGSLGCPWLW
jgi:enoyl-CoA hydratase/carnithine racemase